MVRAVSSRQQYLLCEEIGTLLHAYTNCGRPISLATTMAYHHDTSRTVSADLDEIEAKGYLEQAPSGRVGYVLSAKGLWFVKRLMRTEVQAA